MKLLISLLLSFCLAATPALATNMPKAVMTSTHRIEMTVDNADGPATDICSATAIGPHALLTAAHCDLGSSLVTIDGGVPTAIIERLGDGNDHVIYMVALTFDKFTPFAATKINPGDEVWLRGNPQGLNQLVRHGIYSGVVVGPGGKEVVQMFDVNGAPGDSGSAIFNKHGNIVAVTTYGFTMDGFDMLGALEIRFTKAQLAQAASNHPTPAHDIPPACPQGRQCIN